MICVGNDFGFQAWDQARCPPDDALRLVDHFMVSDKQEYRSLDLAQFFITEYIGGYRVAGRSIARVTSNRGDIAQPSVILIHREALP
jgi:hypothetical protein